MTIALAPAAPTRPVASVGTALQRLRAATQDRHATLDAAMPLSRPAPTLHDYAAHLAMLRDWLAPLETWLAQGEAAPQGLPAAWRLPLLEQDLSDPSLHGLVPAAQPDPAPWPSAGEAYRWGVRYVVEGSQLGGWVLYRQLRDRLAPHPLAYLGGETAPGAVGERWQQVLRALERALPDDASQAEACRGACDAFDRLIALRTRSGSAA